MELNDVIPYSVVLIGSFVLVVAPFTKKNRGAPISVRLLWFLAAPFMFGWSAIGFFLALHKNGTRTNLPWAQFWVWDHLKAHFAGAGVALLLAFLINPEYWRWWLRNRAPTARITPLVRDGVKPSHRQDARHDEE